MYEGTGSNFPWSLVAADTDADGVKEIVGVTQQGILELRASGGLTFEAQLHAVPDGVASIAVEEGTASSPALLHALLSVSNCLPECSDACEGQCLLGVCVEVSGDAADEDGGV